MFSENLSLSLLRLCGDRRLTYETASDLCDLSSRYFGDIVRRQTVPSVFTLEKLCRGFDRTPDELLLQGPAAFRSPMPVTHIHIRPLGEGTASFPVCPQCGCSLEREFQSYCDRCGQCLSWESYENTTALPTL